MMFELEGPERAELIRLLSDENNTAGQALRKAIKIVQMNHLPGHQPDHDIQDLQCSDMEKKNNQAYRDEGVYMAFNELSALTITPMRKIPRTPLEAYEYLIPEADRIKLAELKKKQEAIEKSLS